MLTGVTCQYVIVGIYNYLSSNKNAKSDALTPDNLDLYYALVLLLNTLLISVHTYQLIYNYLKVNKMIKVVIFCCKLCGFFKILALFDDFRVQKGVGKILTPLLQPSFSPPPPFPFPPQKGNP